MKKRQAVSLSLMIALGVLMANGAAADAQNRKEASRRAHDDPANKAAPKPIGGRVARQRLAAPRRSDA